MGPKFRQGGVYLALLLILSVSGFFLIRAVAVRSFSDSQAEVEKGIHERFDPFSKKYSLSHHMGAPSTWQTYTNDSYGYKIKHPAVWIKNKKEAALAPGILDSYEVVLGDHVSFSVNVQNTFVLPPNINKIKNPAGEFYFFQDQEDAKAAVIKIKGLFYIIRLKQQNYFGSEPEFRGTFYQILKQFEFVKK